MTKNAVINSAPTVFNATPTTTAKHNVIINCSTLPLTPTDAAKSSETVDTINLRHLDAMTAITPIAPPQTSATSNQVTAKISPNKTASMDIPCPNTVAAMRPIAKKLWATTPKIVSIDCHRVVRVTNANAMNIATPATPRYTDTPNPAAIATPRIDACDSASPKYTILRHKTKHPKTPVTKATPNPAAMARIINSENTSAILNVCDHDCGRDHVDTMPMRPWSLFQTKHDIRARSTPLRVCLRNRCDH